MIITVTASYVESSKGKKEVPFLHNKIPPLINSVWKIQIKKILLVEDDSILSSP
jgi:hypothetical protein